MVYLAMTASEMRNCAAKPEHIAWMACHFSPYGTGLTNIPASLPPKSLLILNDRTPVRGHDPNRVAETLHKTVEDLQCSGILLDFQRPDCSETAAITESILALSCPVCVTEPYAKALDCPIFLPPVPLLRTVEEYLDPWRGREVWLEISLEGAAITVTKDGSHITALPSSETHKCPSCDMQLFCHFGLIFNQNEAIFTLKRTENDLQNLQNAAEKWGISHFVGLWQELK